MSMSLAPPGDATIPDDRRIHERRGQEPDSLIMDAARLLDVVGIMRSPSWISRTVRAFRAAQIQVPFGVYLAARIELNEEQRRQVAARPELRYLLTYADPTGETAVRNVMRERGF